jgi:TolA-binding protein
MEPEKASLYLEGLIKKYPENILFNYSLAVAEIKKRNTGSAEKILHKVIESKNNKFSKMIAFAGFLMGDVNFRENNFNEAAKYYHNFLNSATDKDYTGIASLRLALCYEINGDRKNAVTYFKHAEKGNQDIEDDNFAARKGGIYSDRTMAETEKGIIKAANLIESGKFADASGLLGKIIPQIKTERLKSEAYYLLSEAQYYMNDFKNSLGNAVTAAQMNSGDEKWIMPYSWFNAARAAVKSGNKKDAEKYLKEAQKYSNFDYRKKLEGMVRNLGKNL